MYLVLQIFNPFIICAASLCAVCIFIHVCTKKWHTLNVFVTICFYKGRYIHGTFASPLDYIAPLSYINIFYLNSFVYAQGHVIACTKHKRSELYC